MGYQAIRNLIFFFFSCPSPSLSPFTFPKRLRCTGNDSQAKMRPGAYLLKLFNIQYQINLLPVDLENQSYL